MPSASTALKKTARVTSLDGLRGLAAIVVLVHHALLTAPVLASAYYGGSVSDASDPVSWALTYTPLHLIWAGTEAVYLFFVLSGVVLTFPVLRSRSFSWLAYYPSRLLRLYGPIVFAVLLGWVLFLAFPRRQDAGLGQWMVARGDEYPPLSIVKDLVLVFGASGVISPLWSLRWEILFSLLLPAYVLVAQRRPGRGWPKAVALLLMVALGAITGSQFLLYLPMFGLGVLAAVHWDALAGAARRLDARRWAWPAVGLLAVALTCVRWEAMAIGVPQEVAERLVPVSLIGVVGIVFCAAFWRPAIAVLDTRIVQWLGALSFSLYLVHEPILIAARLVLPVDLAWLAMVSGAVTAFVVAVVFQRLIERPTHRYAKALARAMSARRAEGPREHITTMGE
ncbi:acyltransferase [Clavibacter michiganensis]|nr:acyltransferase [Clavibacter michiganensis]